MNKNIEYFLTVVFIVVLTIFWNQPLTTQSMVLTNGTETALEYIDTIKNNLINEEVFSPDTKDIKIALVVYKIRDSIDMSVIDDQSVYEGVEVLNNNFKGANLKFHILKIEIIDDYNYAEITSDSIVEELVIMHSDTNIINLYLVNNVELGGTSFFGFTYYPIEREKNYIFLQKEYIMESCLTSLMGSFFGLLPTHETLGGFEFVDSVNCFQGGDFICDTYADPNLIGYVSPSDCRYIGAMRDPRGDFYVPSVANFMSNSTINCKCVFTKLQYKRIKFYQSKYRSYLR